MVGQDPSQPVRVTDSYLRAEDSDPGKVPTPQSSGDQPRDIYNMRVHDLQTVIERLDLVREQIKACRKLDGTPLAERIGVDYRVCRKWLDIVHLAAKDLAVWEQADIKYNGHRHEDEADDDVSEALDEGVEPDIDQSEEGPSN